MDAFARVSPECSFSHFSAAAPDDDSNLFPAFSPRAVLVPEWNRCSFMNEMNTSKLDTLVFTNCTGATSIQHSSESSCSPMQNPESVLSFKDVKCIESTPVSLSGTTTNRFVSPDFYTDARYKARQSIATQRNSLAHHFTARLFESSNAGTSYQQLQRPFYGDDRGGILDAYKSLIWSSGFEGTTSPMQNSVGTRFNISEGIDFWPHNCSSPDRNDIVSYIQLACGHRYAELGCGHKLAEFKCGHMFCGPSDIIDSFFTHHRCPPVVKPVIPRLAGVNQCHVEVDPRACDIYIQVSFHCGHLAFLPCEFYVQLERFCWNYNCNMQQ